MNVAASPTLRIDPALDPKAYASVFRQFGRLHLPGFLRPEDAASLARTLEAPRAWHRSLHVSDGHDLDLPVEEIEELPAGEWSMLETGVYDAARTSFRYMFDTVRVSHRVLSGEEVEPGLLRALTFVNSPGFLNFVRRLTGDPRPVFSDAMATRYLPGHFLTAHHDEAEGEHRLYAYVLSLTPGWRADWGGLLLFLDEDDHVAEGYVPAFNALNIFRVPQRHAVSLVAPFAGRPRYSLTGWIRSKIPPGWP